jgi:hypothetical protein
LVVIARPPGNAGLVVPALHVAVVKSLELLTCVLTVVAVFESM